LFSDHVSSRKWEAVLQEIKIKVQLLNAFMTRLYEGEF
jgi:uncharacterized circularly permuted ATP-grasp superfamily protein